MRAIFGIIVLFYFIYALTGGKVKSFLIVLGILGYLFATIYLSIIGKIGSGTSLLMLAPFFILFAIIGWFAGQGVGGGVKDFEI